MVYFLSGLKSTPKQGRNSMIKVTLEEIAELAKKICPSSKIKLVREDYDEYGSECYVRVVGECADIKIEQDHTGFYCHLVCHRREDKTSAFEYSHSAVFGGIATGYHKYCFLTKKIVNNELLVNISDIEQWLINHSKYLKATSELFERIDEINYPDLRGLVKYGNKITSYDRFLVSDKDFHIDEKIKDTPKVKLYPEHIELPDSDDELW